MDLDPSPSGALRAEGRASGVHFQLYALAIEGPVRWRLLSGNNRDLGRGPTPYLDTAACIDGVSAMRAVLPELQPAMKLTPTNQWVWSLLDGAGAPMVVGGHAYDRQIRCEQGLAQFVRLAPQAIVGESLMVSRARRWA